MTTDKAFKRVVRARMAKTGERYAVARRALTEADPDRRRPAPADAAVTPSGYRMRGGLHPETATIANVLANRGVVSGITGEPLTEGAILGIGGGLGAGYILWEFKRHDAPVLTLGFRNQWQYPPRWTVKTLDQLAIDAAVHETGGAKGAKDALDARLDAGLPVIATVDPQELRTWGLPDAMSGYGGLVVVVIERTADGAYLVDDRGRSPFVVPADILAAARGRVGSYKHRIVALPTTPGPLPADRLRAAIRTGLEDQVEHLRASSDSFSLPAWRKWARLLTDQRNAKAWPRVFADGVGLFGALSAIHEDVDGGVGPGGGHLRELYADFLDEAAAALDTQALGDAAKAWRAVADRWEELADAAVPTDLDGAVDAVEAAEHLHAAVMAGEAGRSRVMAAAETVWSIRERYAEAFPLPPERIVAILEDLGERVGAIHEAEVDALEMTARAIGR